MISEKLVEALVEDARSKAYEQGRNDAQSVDLGEFGYGSCRSRLVVKHFDSFLELRQWLKSFRWRRSGDNPGQLYSQSSKLIALHHTDDRQLQAIAVIDNHYDM